MLKIKIMLIEDHNVVREGLKRLIEMEEDMLVLAEAGTCMEALNNVSPDIDIILLDIKLPDGDGLELYKKIHSLLPDIKFVALTTYDDPLFIKKAIEYGINGFIPKYASFDQIKEAILLTLRTGRYLYPGLNVELLFNLSESSLTELEAEILQRIAGGENQRSIAQAMFISNSTLRRRIKGICTKLGVDSVEEAVASAAKRGLIK